MSRFIDTHSHGIYGVDDGVQDFDGTIRFLEIAVKHRTKILYMTPHYVSDGKYKVSHDDLMSRMTEIRNHVHALKLPIDIRLGSEIYLNEAGLEHLRRGNHWPYENTSYVLIESVPPYELTLIDQAIEELKKSGLKAIIAHPERYFPDVQTCLMTVKRWIGKGAYCSANRTSFLSNSKPWVQNNAFALLNAGLIHVVASDAHHAPGRREPRLDDIYELLVKWGSKDTAESLCIANPQRLAENLDLIDVKPSKNVIKKALVIHRQKCYIQKQSKLK